MAMQTAACLYSGEFGSVRCETLESPTCAAFLSISNKSLVSSIIQSK